MKYNSTPSLTTPFPLKCCLSKKHFLFLLENLNVSEKHSHSSGLYFPARWAVTESPQTSSTRVIAYSTDERVWGSQWGVTRQHPPLNSSPPSVIKGLSLTPLYSPCQIQGTVTKCFTCINTCNPHKHTEVLYFAMYNAHPCFCSCYTWDYYIHYYTHGM